MKVHILFESNELTNGRVVSASPHREDARSNFDATVRAVASWIGDYSIQVADGELTSPDIMRSDLRWSYLPDDIEEHSNVKVMLFLDCEVAAWMAS